ncbi:hypothetical protein KAFR_0A04330 [Kazachstania africana CBS 2517]|uniref:DM2 domain-containing protein n=1 Tax=Kazachstania africana (strain ATCC 22294 / BCRC 22015 / CBS 2517 / CECT 1963 / NBRC 1671 / NRRL Y-8276) TaxID=1071382 RepID=H2ANB8_KAZAF|nr:hypothetical protein KAFR_0A04330 [Kazachstania africana CBS 2517]CCF55868.1 hypothetical protein KAFR_0A04330 [Kazachstania africana CBS 2517]
MSQGEEHPEDVSSFIPYIEAVVPIVASAETDLESIKLLIEDTFLCDLEPYKQDIDDLVRKRRNAFEEITENCISREEMKARQRKLVKDLIHRDSKQTAHDAYHRKRKKTSKSQVSEQRVQLSKDLEELLGLRQSTRAELVRLLWKYIEKNGLQNSDDEQEVFSDEKMRKVFGEKIDEFSINTILQRHTIDLPNNDPKKKKNMVNIEIEISNPSSSGSSGSSDDDEDDEDDEDGQEKEQETGGSKSADEFNTRSSISNEDSSDEISSSGYYSVDEFPNDPESDKPNGGLQGPSKESSSGIRSSGSPNENSSGVEDSVLSYQSPVDFSDVGQ